MIPRSCPICGATSPHDHLHTHLFQDGVLGAGYDVVRCRKCGGTFAEGVPPQDELDRYYKECSKYIYADRHGAESPFDRGRFELIVTHLSGILPSTKVAILDVGSATGGLLMAFKRAGFYNLIGIDPSPECAIAASRLYGVEVKCGTFADLKYWKSRFDLILAIGVLEHVREVRNAIACLKSVLKDGGYLYIAVPDVEGLVKAVNAPFQQFSMEHVNFFSRLSLARVAAEENLKTVRVWQDMVEWRAGVTEPVLAILFSKLDCEVAALTEPIFDNVSAECLSAYIAVSRVMESNLLSRIENLVQSQQPILVWGAGALARRLLVSTTFALMNITAFVDSDPHLMGTRLAGRRILSPAELFGHHEPIVVCSVSFKQEIIYAIREVLGLKNDIIVLPF